LTRDTVQSTKLGSPATVCLSKCAKSRFEAPLMVSLSKIRVWREVGRSRKVLGARSSM